MEFSFVWHLIFSFSPFLFFFLHVSLGWTLKSRGFEETSIFQLRRAYSLRISRFNVVPNPRYAYTYVDFVVRIKSVSRGTKRERTTGSLKNCISAADPFPSYYIIALRTFKFISRTPVINEPTFGQQLFNKTRSLRRGVFFFLLLFIYLFRFALFFIDCARSRSVFTVENNIVFIITYTRAQYRVA